MLLTQKQPNLPIPPTHFNALHRRHPSAPAVVVQPTRTPGLLSLSKPPQRQRPRAPARPKPSVPHHAQSTTEASPQSPEKDSRGRHSKPKDSQKALSARSPSRGHKGHHSRQPSPPILSQVDQVKAPLNPHFNSFDPFLDDFVSEQTTSVRPTTTLSPRPSGKLANRRRQPSHKTPNSNNKPIPVPKPHQNNFISGESTIPFHVNHSPPAPVPDTETDTDEDDPFPVCDDMTDAGDIAVERANESQLAVTQKKAKGRRGKSAQSKQPSTRPAPSFPLTLPPRSDPEAAAPTTPTRPTRTTQVPSQQRRTAPHPQISLSGYFDLSDGPKTAPITSASNADGGSFPFSTPSKMRGNGAVLDASHPFKGHQRAPSVGVLLGPSTVDFARRQTGSDDEDIVSKRKTGNPSYPGTGGKRKFAKSMSMNTATSNAMRRSLPAFTSAGPNIRALGAAFNLADSSAEAAPLSSSLPLANNLSLAAVFGGGVGAGFFASSQFQNSPSPEELPPPPF